MESSKRNAQFINQSCTCKTLNQEELAKRLEKTGVLKSIYQEIVTTRPNLFSSTMVFISEEDSMKIKELIRTIEKVIHRPAFMKKVLQNSPDIARVNTGLHGVFMGYDFHLTEAGPKLIEINTNAGGILLNAELAQAQSSCCVDVSIEKNLEEIIFQTFVNEWRIQRGEKKLRRVAIVDEDPEQQFLYPEFLLFQRLFENRGIACDILAPENLVLKPEGLIGPQGLVDLVYNRLTHFYFEGQNLESLKKAYLTGAVVLTPTPFHHALFAKKKNLAFLKQLSMLDDNQLSDKERLILREAIPNSFEIQSCDLEDLWNKRKGYFFKPVSGFGSRGSYRGDKLTRRVWKEITVGEYIAQEVIPPGLKLVDIDGKTIALKVDIRAYTYQTQVILLAARLYSGQTTNFRTPGGGFAPVFTTP